jgi:hypothetical protein
MSQELYTDGGFIFDGQLGRSSLGLVWAYRLVETAGATDEILQEECGVFSVTALKELTHGWMESVTSPMAESYAMLRGLNNLPADWSGKVFCDNLNLVNACRTMKADPDGIEGVNVVEKMSVYLPEGWLRGLCKALVWYMGKEVEWVHLSGHPAKEDLKRGTNKEGVPVSRHNDWCDKACNKAKVVWMSEQGITLDKTKARGEFCAVRLRS